MPPNQTTSRRRAPARRRALGSLVATAVTACALSACQATTREPRAPASEENSAGEGDEDAATPAAHGSRTFLAEVEGELHAMTRSTYTHRTNVDRARGTFDYDCSGFVVYALSHSARGALSELQATTPRRPRSIELVTFFMTLPRTGSDHWQRIEDVRDLRPGDVIAWLKPADSTSKNTGHTVVVHGAPIPDERDRDAFIIPVVDATATPHGRDDLRRAEHRTGLGEGRIELVTDAAGAPVAYRWSVGGPSKRTTIAIARPLPDRAE